VSWFPGLKDGRRAELKSTRALGAVLMRDAWLGSGVPQMRQDSPEVVWRQATASALSRPLTDVVMVVVKS
jgi:hypothetical protein